ncbi:MAG: hypothetical protein GY929_13205 [Actinomycetia bacterium]|nr:hypothetical protein [Actinomycetes bacterium]
MTTPDHDDGPRWCRVVVAVGFGLVMLVAMVRADLVSVGHAAGLTIAPETLTIDVVGNPP